MLYTGGVRGAAINWTEIRRLYELTNGRTGASLSLSSPITLDGNIALIMHLGGVPRLQIPHLAQYDGYGLPHLREV
jgi:hypothetical protein